MNCFLNPETVHVWSIKLSDVIEHLPYFVSILSKTERIRSFEYKSKLGYHHFVVSKAMVRLLLEKYMGQDLKSITIDQTRLGKPTVNSSNAIHFNITHSGEYCLIAFSRSGGVGIDLEHQDQLFEMEQAIDQVFTDEEIQAWKSCSSSEKSEMFYRKWVSVEAFLKARGTGWLADETLIKEAKALVPHFPVNGYSTVFNTQQPVLLDIIEGYASALCVLTPVFSIEFKDGKDLIF